MEAISNQLCFKKMKCKPQLINQCQSVKKTQKKQDSHSCTLNHYGQFSFPSKAQV